MLLQSRKNWDWHLERVTLLALGGAIVALSGGYASAQEGIIPDNTLGAESSIVTPNVKIDNFEGDRIDGGAIRGTNLFHSFSEFNINNGRGAYFANPAGIENILTRVTGANPSNIQGILGVLGKANLFFINPHGLLFGPNAQLNVEGSFFASTASSINFADRTQFSASAPQAKPLLSVSVPTGLQFEGIVGSIRNQSTVIGTVSGLKFPVGLQVQPGKTIALVGGELLLEDGNLTTEAGRIELGSVTGSSLVSLTQTTEGWELGYEGVQNFEDIILSQEAQVLAGLTGGGNIQVQGRRVTLSDGSWIATFTQGAQAAGNLNINASESVELVGYTTLLNGKEIPTRLTADTAGNGSAGNITITTRQLIVRDGAEISASTTLNSQGEGGNLFVTASEYVELGGSSASGQIFSAISAQSEGNGSAGNIEVDTGQLTIKDGAQIASSNTGQGEAGTLTIDVRNTLQANDSEISTSSAQSTGGAINITAGDIRLRGNSDIRTDVQGAGGGGNITLKADSIIAFDDSDIFAFSRDGQGGNITLDTPAFFAESFRPDTSDINPDLLEGNDRVDINASGAVSGAITLPDVSFIQNSLVELPQNPIDPASLLATSCIVRGDSAQSSFTVTGSGGLPSRPEDAFVSSFPIGAIQTIPPEAESEPAQSSRRNHFRRNFESAPNSDSSGGGWQEGDPIIEPTGVYRLPSGQLVISRECS